MLLKGSLVEAGRAAAQASRTPAVAPHVRPLSSRRHVAFKGVRPSVRANAAEPAAEQAAPAATARVPRVPMSSIKAGDELEGTVRAVADIGAFIDVGVENGGKPQDGLLHISQLSEGRVSDVSSLLQKGQKLAVVVLGVDLEKGRISLAPKVKFATNSGGAPARAAAPEEDADGITIINERDSEAGPADLDDDEVEVELDEGQVAVYADLPGYDDIPFVMDEDNADEINEASIAAMEEDLDAVQIVVQAETPSFMTEVEGKVTRIEDYGMFLEFQWNGKNLTGLMTRDEMKVPVESLSEEAKAELRAEWAATPFELPMYAAPPEGDEFDIKKYYQPGATVHALVLETAASGAKGISLTHFTDEDVAAEAVDAFEALEEDEDEELDELLADADELHDEVMAFDPVEMMDQEDDEESATADEVQAAHADGDDGYYNYSSSGQEDAQDAFSAATFRGALMGNTAAQGHATVAPLGFPSRPLAEPLSREALSILPTHEEDFDGDEVQLFDYWSSEIVDNMPKGLTKMMGLKMAMNKETGEAEWTAREDAADAQAPLFFLPEYNGTIEDQARAIVEDLLDDDVDEAELPARALRRPVVLAAAVSSISASAVKALRDKTGAGMMDCKKALAECSGNEEEAAEWLRKKGLSGADKKAGRIAAEGAVVRYIHPGSRLGVLLEVNCETDFVAASEKFNKLVNELGMIIASTDCICVSADDVPAEVLAKEREVEMGKEDIKSKPEAIRAKIVEGRLEKMRAQVALVNQQTLSDPNKTVADLVKETIAAVGENIKIRRFIKYRLGEGIEKRSNDFAAEVAQQTQAKAAPPAPKKEEPKKEEPKAAAKPTVQVSATVVKELRDKTGAGMMDCKKALAENGGDMDASVEWLRKKGLAGADKKAGRIAAEGVVASYIHPGSRLGVLLEVNCETDFVAASEKFNQLVSYIAMGIVAGQNVQYVSADEIPAEVFEREKQIEMGREDLKSKPDAIRAKIAEGRVKKLGQEMALLDQPFLTDPTKTVADAIKEAIAAIGEKISVRRFVKFQLGEGLEKKSNDFAAEVAAATGQK